MALDAERIIDLAPAGQFGLVDRYLPDPYRRALTRTGDPMASLTRASRDALRRALSELEAVQRSRALAFFDDLSDGALLGAIHDQSPWPEDTTKTFRDRLTRVSALAMRGAATADRLLMIAAIACGATRLTTGAGADLIGPKQGYDFTLVQKGPDGSENRQTFAGSTGEGQSRRFVRKTQGAAVFPIDVLDAPLRRFAQDITPIPGADGLPDRDYRFVLDNPGSETVGGLDMLDPITWPDPVFEVKAGARPFGPFGFVNTFSAEVIFVNRIIAPNGTLAVDTRQMAWKHGTGETKIARYKCFGEKAAIYAGFALSLDDHRFGSGPLGPLLSLRTKDKVTFTGAKSEGPPVLTDLTEDVDLTLPSLLGEGQSQWRLIELADDTHAGDDIHAARFRAVRGNADISLSAYWYGRRPGEFTLAVPQSALAPDLSGPLAHRTAWLDQMVERFKLAGTVRISQDLLFEQFEAFEDTTELTLTDRVTARDEMLVTDPLVLRDSVMPSDTVRILQGVTFGGTSALRPTDSVDLVMTSAQPDALLSVVQPTDAMTLKSGLPSVLRSALTPTDTVTVLPELSFSWRSVGLPFDTVEVSNEDASLDVLRSATQPTDSITVAEGLPPVLRSTLTPRDDVIVLPELSFDWRSVGIPSDTVEVTDDDARIGVLRSTAQPTDSVAIAEGLPANFTSTLSPTDWIEILPEVSFGGRSVATPTDIVFVTDDEAKPDDLRSVLVPRDGIVVAEGLPAVLTARVEPVDTVVILPEVSVDLGSATTPFDNVVIVDENVAPDPLRSTITPRDDIIVQEGLPPVFVTRLTPVDTISVQPEIGLTGRSTVTPTDGLKLTDDEVRPKPLTSTATPTDRVTIAQGFPTEMRSGVTPVDTISLEPGKKPDPIVEPDVVVRPGGGGGGDDPGDTEPHIPIVFPVFDDADVLRIVTPPSPPIKLKFQSTVVPTDRFKIRRLRR